MMAGPSQLKQDDEFKILVEEDPNIPTESDGAGSAIGAKTRRAAKIYNNGANKTALGTTMARASAASSPLPTPSPDENKRNPKHHDDIGTATLSSDSMTGNCTHTPTNEEESAPQTPELPQPATRRRSSRLQSEQSDQKGDKVNTRSKGSYIAPEPRLLRRSSRLPAAGKDTGNSATPGTLRRSSRLVVKDTQPSTSQSVLGKRTRGSQKSSQTTARRASLRPRNAIPETKKKEEPKAKPKKAEPKQKEKASQASPSPSEKPPTEAVAATPIRKIWLDHGLFAAHNTYSKNELSNTLKRLKSKNKSAREKGPFFPPLPLHGGASLIENGRDFKLPFDVFSPLPPGQPKPDEWRTINKSMCILTTFKTVV